MPQQLSPHFLQLLQDALLKSFWYKRDLKAFLRRCGLSESVLAQLSESDRKIEWIDHLFPKLERIEQGQRLLIKMGRALAEQKSFPGLERVEDSDERIRFAQFAVASLSKYLDEHETRRASEHESAAIRRRAAEILESTIRSQATLSTLRARLDELGSQIGTQDGGYAFQTWFYDLMDFFEVDNRRPYVASGRQIDGSVTVDGTTYLVELKFTGDQAVATDVDSLLAKVNSKADNTMGLMVSISGFTSVAIEGASSPKTPLLLFDFQHIYNLVLMGVEKFPDVIRRVRRHSSQTGNAYLPATEFGN